MNCTGEVYLTIPAAQNGEGKVQIRVQGAVREYDAMTPGEQLGNGTPIRVIRTINSHTVAGRKSLTEKEFNQYHFIH